MVRERGRREFIHQFFNFRFFPVRRGIPPIPDRTPPGHRPRVNSPLPAPHRSQNVTTHSWSVSSERSELRSRDRTFPCESDPESAEDRVRSRHSERGCVLKDDLCLIQLCLIQLCLIQPCLIQFGIDVLVGEVGLHSPDRFAVAAARWGRSSFDHAVSQRCVSQRCVSQRCVSQRCVSGARHPCPTLR